MCFILPKTMTLLLWSCYSKIFEQEFFRLQGQNMNHSTDLANFFLKNIKSSYKELSDEYFLFLKNANIYSDFPFKIRILLKIF